jgi:hypothetical protein
VGISKAMKGMRIAILSAVLGDFETSPKDPVEQELPEGVESITFHRFTDKDFPPINGLTPRLQYRIPKLFGWQMFPGYDFYIWLDGGMSLQRADCVKWIMEQLEGYDFAFFKHPQRDTVKQEVEHIEEKLEQGNEYITKRYKNGLHREMYDFAMSDCDYTDDNLYATTVFAYENNDTTQDVMWKWWSFQSRYFTCDQVNLPYALFISNAKVNKIQENLFKIGYISLVSHHK